MPAKKKAKKKTTKKKAAASKKAVRKSTASRKAKKKSAARKKTSKKKTSKKKASKKASAPKKKKTAKKKAGARKKVARKKSSARKKTASKKPAGKKAGKKATAKKAASRKVSRKKAAPAKKTAKKKTAARPAGQIPQPRPVKHYKRAKGEEYMNPAQVEHFRNILTNWKHELMEEVDRTVHHMQDEASNFPDPNDRATQEEEFALELRTRDRERKLIKKINEALQSLETGDYGYCEICGVEIGINRLEARPTATLCIDCKTLDEIKERQLG